MDSFDPRLWSRPVVLGLVVALGGCSEGDRFLGPGPTFDASQPPTRDGSSRPEDAGPDEDGAICGEADLPIARVIPEVLIILDRSGSMSDEDHWTDVREALYSVTEALDERLAFGLMVFPDPSGDEPCGLVADPCVPGRRPLVRPARRTAGRIRSTLSPMIPCGGTPTAATLEGARASFALGVDPTHLPPVEAVPAYVVLATDGAPNCNPDADDATCRCTGGGSCAGSPTACLDDEATYEAIDGLRARGVRLFVVGIAASPFRDVLDTMAERGGTDAALMTQNEAGIREAFESITGRVTSCELVVGAPDAAVDRDRVNVYLDDVALPMDDDGACDEGWQWSDERRTRIVLCGEACDRLREDRVEEVRATFGCPTLI